jgi:hypothetical protein
MWCLQGTVPADWGYDNSLPSLTTLTLSYNERLSGTLPATWGSDNSSFTKLQVRKEPTLCLSLAPRNPAETSNPSAQSLQRPCRNDRTLGLHVPRKLAG